MNSAILLGARRVVGALGLLALTACGSVYSDLCDRQAECEGGNDADIEACIAEAEGTEEAYSAYDCSDPYDKLVDCYDRTGNCEDKNYSTNCGDEAEALVNCRDAASAR